MAVALALAFAVVATLLTWTALSSRHHHLWTVFVAYISLLPIFGAAYHTYYLRDPQNFAFTSDIADRRLAQIDGPLRSDLERLNKIEPALRRVLANVSQNSIFVPDPENATRVTVGTGQNAISLQWHRFSLEDDGRTKEFDGLTAAPGASATQRNFYNDTVAIAIEESDGHPLANRTRTMNAQIVRAWVLRSLEEKVAERATLMQTLDLPSRLRSDQWGFLDFLYFSVITQATIGYGDIIPNSRSARMLVMTQVLLAVALLTAVLTYAAAFIQRRRLAG